MENKFAAVVHNVGDTLRSALPYEEYSNICVYCVFMKYMLENELLPYDKTTFDLQKMFDREEINENALLLTSSIIEEKFCFPQSSLVDFAQTYVRFNTQSAGNLSSRVLKLLNEISFSDVDAMLIDALKEMLYLSASNFARLLSDKVSNRSLATLAGELLDIQDDDSYADFMYGVGTSTLEIIGDKKCSITGYDINRSSIAVAKMLLIMSGRDSCNLKVCDAFEDTESGFDKIAVMPPLGVKIKDIKPYHAIILKAFELPKKSVDMVTLAIFKSIMALKDDGISVVFSAPNFLWSNAVVEREARKMLANRYLKAVILLPALCYGTSIPVVALVIAKERPEESVTFIDASTNNFFDFIDNSNRAVTQLTDAGIAKIKEIYLNGLNVEGVSQVVSIRDIESNDYLLTHPRYIKVKNKRESISNDEIDRRLNELYAKLKEYIDE